MAEKQTIIRREIRPERILALGFLVMILAGTLLLALPVSSSGGQGMGWLNGLFTATSAVCVTGLVAVDTGRALSFFGQGVLLVLIQLGGLGFMIFATLIMAALGRRISLRERVLIRESVSASTFSGLMRLTRVYGLMALMIEGAGALLLAVRFVPLYGWGKGIWYAAFHSVSAFCNAGFDLLGEFASLTAFSGDAWVLTVIALLVTLGGLGFSVLQEVVQGRRLSLHARIVLISSGVLLTAGTLFFALVEWHNPYTLDAGSPSAALKWVNACFQAVTMRTAGFNSVSLSGLRDASKLLSVMLMFIGASPASTGGGVKTTTVSVLVLIVLSVIRGHEQVHVFGRRLPSGLMRRALAVMMISLGMLLAGAMALALAELDGYPFIDLLFEAASALATVGVSAIGTPRLREISRLILVPLMYFGRVGPLTLALALARRQNRGQERLRFPEEDVMIG